VIGVHLRGLAASPGTAVGPAFVMRADDPVPDGRTGGPAEVERALSALAAAAAELGRAAEKLREAGLDAEAEVVETSRMIAEDPALADDVAELAAAAPASRAVAEAVELRASAIAAIADPVLSARASDVRELGRRAIRILTGGAGLRIDGDTPVVVLARDLGPGEVAELEVGDGRVAALALAEGAATSHAAIMARSLGLPLVVGLGSSVLAVEPGETVVVHGDSGVVVISPTDDELDSALETVRIEKRRRSQLAGMRRLPAETTDGRRVSLLCNASTAAEVAAGLAAGAEGVGLLRTELAFLEAERWPTEAEHRAAIEPALSLLSGRAATVRTLDFGGDKSPPFLSGVAERGVGLMLAHPEELASQLRAIVAAAGRARLRVLLPLVRTGADLRDVRELLGRTLPPGTPPPALGAMIETPQAVSAVAEIARESDFLSLGTNDLVATTLGLDREAPLAAATSAAEPAVLRLVARTIEAAQVAGISVEVCGESASEPALAALYVGLGVDELSVAPPRLDVVRATIREISSTEARNVAVEALEAASATAALALAARLIDRSELRNNGGEALDGFGGPVA
jgi:phosphoenolpyruvate-protein kinase (PTS system EI component)